MALYVLYHILTLFAAGDRQYLAFPHEEHRHQVVMGVLKFLPP